MFFSSYFKVSFLTMPKFNVKINEVDSLPIYDKYFSKKSIGFRTKNSGYFKSIMTFISNIVSIVNIKLNKDGFHILSMDKAHVSLINCFIPSNIFSSFNYSDGKTNETVLGINLESFIKILNHINPNDELILEYKGDSIDISFIHEKYKKFYTLKLMDIECDELSIFDCDQITGINMESKYFNEIINDFTDIGDIVKINISKERIDDENQNISLECSGDMTGVQMILCNEDLTIHNLQDIELEFNLANLQIFAKGYNLNKYMSIDINQNYPLKLSYEIMNTGYIHYFVAPRITNDD